MLQTKKRIRFIKRAEYPIAVIILVLYMGMVVADCIRYPFEKR